MFYFLLSFNCKDYINHLSMWNPRLKANRSISICIETKRSSLISALELTLSGTVKIPPHRVRRSHARRSKKVPVEARWGHNRRRSAHTNFPSVPPKSRDLGLHDCNGHEWPCHGIPEATENQTRKRRLERDPSVAMLRDIDSRIVESPHKMNLTR